MAMTLQFTLPEVLSIAVILAHNLNCCLLTKGGCFERHLILIRLLQSKTGHPTFDFGFYLTEGI